jgi:hypothetical protein
MKQRIALQLVLAAVMALGVSLTGIAFSAGKVEAATSLHLSASAIPAGGFVTVNGDGFSANSVTVVSSKVSVGGKAQTVQASTTTNGNGSFSVQLVFPAGTEQGGYTITARDFPGHTANAPVAILPVANIIAGGTAGTTNGIPLHRVWINATGYAANEQVTFVASFPLYNGNTTTVRRTRKANDSGNINGLVIVIPNDARPGNVTMTATGATSKKSGTTKLNVFYRPSITLRPSTARPGTSVTVAGFGFVPGSGVQVSIPIKYTNGTPATLGRTVTANGNGNFSAAVFLPSSVQAGGYTVTAHDNTGGFHTSRHLTVSVKPTINLTPTTVYPGQTVKVSGNNFGNGVTVHVTATVQTSAGSRQIAAQTVSTSNGSYAVNLTIPGNAQAGNVVITARSANAHTQSTLHVQLRPTAVPTSVPPTATPLPTATPKPSHHHNPSLNFQYISIWYHWMKQGTQEHIIVQSTIHATQGIWVNVWYPNGQHQAWFQNTNSSGQWSMWFTVPRNSATRTNDHALVTFRLWHGKNNVKDYSHFGIVR